MVAQRYAMMENALSESCWTACLLLFSMLPFSYQVG